MTQDHNIFLFGVNRAHEWQVSELVSKGFNVHGWHSGGPAFAPAGLKVAEPRSHYGFLKQSDVFYLNESHFAVAESFAVGLGANFRGWEGEHNNKHSQRVALHHLMPDNFRFGRAEVFVEWDPEERLFVKPSIQTGASAGVRSFSRMDREEAVRHFAELSKSGRDPIVESEILGHEYCVDGISKEGEIQWLSVGRYFYRPYEDWVSGILFGATPQFLVRELKALSSRVLSSLRYANGPFHIEYRISNDGVAPIEAHGRFGGSIVTEAAHRLSGLSPFAQLEVPQAQWKNNHLIWSEFLYPGQISFTGLQDFLFESTTQSSLTAFPRLAQGCPENKRVGYLTVAGKNFAELGINRNEMVVLAREAHQATIRGSSLLKGAQFGDYSGSISSRITSK